MITMTPIASVARGEANGHANDAGVGGTGHVEVAPLQEDGEDVQPQSDHTQPEFATHELHDDEAGEL